MAEKDAEIEALKERINALEGKIGNLQNASNDSSEIKAIKERVEYYKDMINAYKANHDKTINLYRNIRLAIIGYIKE